MSLRSFVIAIFFGLVLLVACGLLWFATAPTRFGGSVDYISVHGTAVDPDLHDGDLAVVVPTVGYEVGDVVGYRNRDLHRTTVGRIVGYDVDRYVFRARDGGSYETSSSDLIGSVWFTIPGGPRLRSWWAAHVTLIAGLVAYFVLLGAVVVAARRARTSRRLARRVERAVFRPSFVAATAFGVLALEQRHSSSNLFVFAVAGFFVSGFVLGLAILARSVAHAPDELTRIRRRHRHRIVQVVVPPTGAVVDMPTFEELIAIAGATERMIRQVTHSGVTTFYVDDGETVYRYRVGPLVPDPEPEPAGARVSVG